jgi:hypothetical protein
VHISTKAFLELLELGVDGAVLSKVTRHIPKPIVVKTVGSDPTNFSTLIIKKHLSGK